MKVETHRADHPVFCLGASLHYPAAWKHLLVLARVFECYVAVGDGIIDLSQKISNKVSEYTWRLDAAF